MLLSREIDPATALHWGVANAVCEPRDLAGELRAWTTRLSQVSPRAAALAKALLLDEENPAESYPRAALAVRSSPDAEVGINAFLAKTAAVF